MLKLQSFGYLMQRASSLEMTLMLGQIEGKRRRGQQRMRWLDSITYSMEVNLTNLWEIMKDKIMKDNEDNEGSLTCCSLWGCKDWDTT